MPKTITQTVPITAETIERYAGKWVATRGDEVIAAAESLEKLRENPAVRRTDAVYIVPEHPAYFYPYG